MVLLIPHVSLKQQLTIKERGMKKMENIIIKKILLRTPLDVKTFCNLMNTTPRNATVVVEHNEFTVSGRSILGMFSLNLSEPVTLRINIPDTETDFDEKAFLKSLKEWE